MYRNTMLNHGTECGLRQCASTQRRAEAEKYGSWYAREHFLLHGCPFPQTGPESKSNSEEWSMKTWLTLLSLVAGLCLLASGRLSLAAAQPTPEDFRRLEQRWLDAASVPDLPVLQKMFADDFMGTSFGGGVLGKSDVVPADGMPANHLPKSVLKDSTVRLFGDTAVLMGTVEMQVLQKPEQIRMTTVFQQRGDDWQVIAVHMSKSEQPK
jgi:ketosteroid isomerase-like protein